MFAELGVLRNKVGTKTETIKKYGAVQYAVPVKYGMFPESRITVYPGGYMHRLKGMCGNLPELGTPKSVFVLRSRIEILKQAATEMLVSGKFSTGRFEVSIARAANVDEAVNHASNIWTKESSRIDMVIMPNRFIETMLERMAQLPSSTANATCSLAAACFDPTSRQRDTAAQLSAKRAESHAPAAAAKSTTSRAAAVAAIL
jgi:hypothetical protein